MLVSLVLIGFASVGGAHAAAPYINCPAASALDERTICRTIRLVQLDAEMATLYRLTLSLVGMGTRDSIKDEQADWLRARRACRTSVPCLRNHYEDRIETLDAILDRVRSEGPF
ncbi:MAG TPA: hypothetical protein DCL54_04195 [Alphaproteobacteria bacterium]|nr:hypothetical protein [Alphaproteobacteria bacterium]HAJ45765.1 hypothetical protein [Alphaproteobacteria bacterium]